MSCLNCPNSPTYTKVVGPHVGEYCGACHKWIRWIKQNKNPSTVFGTPEVILKSRQLDLGTMDKLISTGPREKIELTSNDDVPF